MEELKNQIPDTNYNVESGEEKLTQESTKEVLTPQQYEDVDNPMGTILSIFLFVLSLGGVVSLVYPFLTFNLSDYSGSLILALGDIFAALLYVGMCGYTVYSFVKRKPNAVFLGKACIMYSFVTNLFIFVVGIFNEFDETGFYSSVRLGSSLIWGVIWFVFLCVSSEVEDRIPSRLRKCSKLDKILIAAMYVIPFCLMAMGVVDVAIHGNQFQSKQLQFEIPVGYTCDTIATEKIVVYQMENETDVITMCSAVETDFSKENFIDYWDNWIDPDINEYEHRIVEETNGNVNDYEYYCRVVEYDLGVPYHWHYYFLYDEKNSKVCITSIYTIASIYTNEKEYYKNFIKSINF